VILRITFLFWETFPKEICASVFVMMAALVPKLFYYTAYPTDSFPKKKVDSQNRDFENQLFVLGNLSERGLCFRICDDGGTCAKTLLFYSVSYRQFPKEKS
jgi:hypothetical protein